MKPKTLRDDAYKAWIRTLPCIVCLAQAGYLPEGPFTSDPHHVVEDGHGSTAHNTSDWRCIPLCRLPHHHEYHLIGKHSFAAKHGIDYEAIIGRLNALYLSLKE